MNQEKILVAVKLLVLIGFAFTSCALTLGIVTYVIPSWFVFTPDSPSSLISAWQDVPRMRGIFQECSVTPGQPVSPVSPFVKINDCFQSDFGQYPTQYSTTDPSYLTIQRIRISQLVLHGISLPLSLVILFLGVGIIIKWCYITSDSTFYIKWRLAFGLISILTFLLMSCSGSLATALAFVENNQAYKTSLLPYSQFNLNVTLAYGTMYILAWVSAGFSLIAAIFFLISVCLGSRLEEQKYKPRIISVDNPNFSRDDGINMKPVFLTPYAGDTYERTFNNVMPNDTTSPGLLPRYNINA